MIICLVLCGVYFQQSQRQFPVYIRSITYCMNFLFMPIQICLYRYVRIGGYTDCFWFLSFSSSLSCFLSIFFSSFHPSFCPFFLSDLYIYLFEYKSFWIFFKTKRRISLALSYLTFCDLIDITLSLYYKEINRKFSSEKVTQTSSLVSWGCEQPSLLSLKSLERGGYIPRIRIMILHHISKISHYPKTMYSLLFF